MTQTLVGPFAHCSVAAAEPDFTQTSFLSPSVSIPKEDSYEFGCRLHLLLRRTSDRSRLSPCELKRLPWLNAIRQELRSHGVTQLQPEVTLSAHGLPAGRCDLLLSGGLADVGVAELKVTSRLPSAPNFQHYQQLSRYADLIAADHRAAEVWGVLVYVHRRTLRFFYYRNCLSKAVSNKTSLAA
jgi:hypothetical protein